MLWNASMKISNEDVLRAILGCDCVATSEKLSPENKYLSLALSERCCDICEVSEAQIESEVTELLRQHAASLARYAAGIARDKALAPDAIQEVFLRYFIARIEGQQIENPRAWLFRVLSNYLRDCNRKAGSMSTVNLDAAEQVADSRQDLETGFQQNEAFQYALASLSPREQECMRLRLEGFGYDEIARILQIQPGTVGALLARSMKKIRKAGWLSGRRR
jgi:RNA polymerase sigma-70 factor, ECF subfamily